MITAVRIPLFPSEDQEIRFREFCGTSRFVYNLTLDYKIQCYKNSGHNCTLKELMAYVREYKYSEEYNWLMDIPEAIQKQAIKDMLSAYNGFFKAGKGFPKFKKKNKSKLSFYQRTDNLRLVDNTHIKLTGICTPVRIHNLYENLSDLMEKPKNPRVKYDGKFWYLTFSIECADTVENLENDVVGIDLGIKNLAVTSDGRVYKNINKSRKINQLEKKKKHLQRIISRKYESNKIDGRYVKTKNISKIQAELTLIQRKLNCIRDTYVHAVTNDLVKAKPSQIVIEDLNVSSMMKNRYLAKPISEQCFYKFRKYLSYKCSHYGIDLIIADRFFASSKVCSCCGNRKSSLSLSERIYKCEYCGITMDRDLNAAMNLRNYAYSH